jgi:hypothetical protein
MPYAAPDYGSSGMALLGAVVLIVMGALVGIISLFVLLIGLAGRELLELADPALGDFGPGFMTAIVVIAVIFIIVAVLHFVAGIGVLAHRTWARWLGIVIGVLGLVLGILAILGSVGDPTMAAGDWLVPVAWTVAYVLALVGLAGGGRQFERRYPYR